MQPKPVGGLPRFGREANRGSRSGMMAARRPQRRCAGGVAIAGWGG
jgi:hypothetical protein